ncbi:hypothetical protein Tsp_12488 [Trichinella spiralis]|uniref:hypothetical protein n=1 Tax=Trichinella spiralis TaxID=6334 RepID=UPI0001EFE20F|nr:hypothetical protein Tsp_12488 [Trichinella spiralis]
MARNGSIIRNAPASSGNGSLDLSKSAFQSLSLPLQVLPQIPIGERPIARRESMSLANVSEVPNEKRFLSRGVPFPPSSLSKSNGGFRSFSSLAKPSFSTPLALLPLGSNCRGNSFGVDYLRSSESTPSAQDRCCVQRCSGAESRGLAPTLLGDRRDESLFQKRVRCTRSGEAIS